MALTACANSPASTKGTLDLSGRPKHVDQQTGKELCPPLKPIDTSKGANEDQATAGWGYDRYGHAGCYRAFHADETYLDNLEKGFGAVKRK